MNGKAFQVYLKSEGRPKRESTLGNASQIFSDTYDGRMMLLSYVLQTRMVGNLDIDPSDIPEVERIIVFEDCPSDANAYIRGAFIVEWVLFDKGGLAF